MPASVESPAGTAPSLLLIEEYDALAAAITSALKKFAPQHRTRAVESLGEAEMVAAEIRPELFVIDFDPPHPNTIEFLERMCAAHPGARVLAIASGTSQEIASERYGPNAIQFVEKPFELADFGAAVQALLGPWTEASSGDSRGTLRNLNLRDLLPLACMSGATSVLEIAATHERTGEIHFVEGHICHASTTGLSGTEALHEIMRWRNAHGRESARPVDGPRTIQGPWKHVFLEALRRTKPSPEEPAARLPSPSSVEDLKPSKVQAKNGKKIVVIDDTEMLSIFVEDVLSIADPSLQILTALTGTEGARCVEEMIPDLVLLDYSLPDLRGDQVCECLLRNKATARVPVVIMSGHVPEMMTTAERYPNVVATIAKPFMSAALVNIVKEILAKGPLPAAPRKETPPVPPVVDPHISVISSASKQPRHGNGRKPVRHGDSLKGETKEVLETSIPAAPVPIVIPPPSPPASSIAITEPTPAVETRVVSHRPIPRDIRPGEPELLDSPPLHPVARAAKLAEPNGRALILGLGVEVTSVQFTARFQIGTIRAKPSLATLSLTHLLTPSVAENRTGAGFELGTAQLDSDGRIRTLRVVPTRRPADPIRTHNGFQIHNVKLLNENAIQLVAGTSAPMTMQLVGVFTVAAVELSDQLEVAQLVLQPEGSRVRITLDPRARGTAGTEFETVGVRLDGSGRITEFVLNLATA